jgi:hypothetical protein
MNYLLQGQARAESSLTCSVRTYTAVLRFNLVSESEEVLSFIIADLLIYSLDANGVQLHVVHVPRSVSRIAGPPPDTRCISM